VPTSNGKEREGNRKIKGRDGKGEEREGRGRVDPRPGWESAKVATPGLAKSNGSLSPGL